MIMREKFLKSSEEKGLWMFITLASLLGVFFLLKIMFLEDVFLYVAEDRGLEVTGSHYYARQRELTKIDTLFTVVLLMCICWVVMHGFIKYLLTKSVWYLLMPILYVVLLLVVIIINVAYWSPI